MHKALKSNVYLKLPERPGIGFEAQYQWYAVTRGLDS
jgi:hypothetical protein